MAPPSLVRLYLDVDGVISPYRAPKPADNTWTDWIQYGLTPISRDMADALASLDAERVWLTSWLHMANEELLGDLGWTPLPVLDTDHPTTWRKLDALVQHHPSPRPFIWVDDDINDQKRELRGRFTSRVKKLASPHLIIVPLPDVGITPDHVEQMRKFIQEHSNSQIT